MPRATFSSKSCIFPWYFPLIALLTCCTAGNRQGHNRRGSSGRRYPCENYCESGVVVYVVAFSTTSQVPDGSKNVQVGSVIAVVGEEGDDLSGAAALAEQASKQAPAVKEEKAPEPPKEERSTPPAPKSKPAPETKAELPVGDRIFASPIAKKIALERGIPLAQVKGTGPNGRIIREDIENFKPAPTTAQPAAVESTTDYIDIPLSNMRRTIGARLTQSKQELPHYYLTVEINMDKVLKLREVFNKTLTEKDKTSKLSVNDFIVKAASCALVDVPEANSAWLGEVIRQ